MERGLLEVEEHREGEKQKRQFKKHTTVKSNSFYANKLFMERKQKGRDYRKGQHWQGSDLALKTGKVSSVKSHYYLAVYL